MFWKKADQIKSLRYTIEGLREQMNSLKSCCISWAGKFDVATAASETWQSKCDKALAANRKLQAEFDIFKTEFNKAHQYNQSMANVCRRFEGTIEAKDRALSRLGQALKLAEYQIANPGIKPEGTVVVEPTLSLGE